MIGNALILKSNTFQVTWQCLYCLSHTAASTKFPIFLANFQSKISTFRLSGLNCCTKPGILQSVTLYALTTTCISTEARIVVTITATYLTADLFLGGGSSGLRAYPARSLENLSNLLLDVTEPSSLLLKQRTST